MYGALDHISLPQPRALPLAQAGRPAHASEVCDWRGRGRGRGYCSVPAQGTLVAELAKLPPHQRLSQRFPAPPAGACNPAARWHCQGSRPLSLVLAPRCAALCTDVVQQKGDIELPDSIVTQLQEVGGWVQAGRAPHPLWLPGDACPAVGPVAVAGCQEARGGAAHCISRLAHPIPGLLACWVGGWACRRLLSWLACGTQTWIAFLALCPLPPCILTGGPLHCCSIAVCFCCPVLWQVWPTWACLAVCAVRCWVAGSTAVFGRRAAQ